MKNNDSLVERGTLPCRYQFKECLGKGGTGSVYLAQRRDSDRLVALKILDESLADNLSAAKRFDYEASIWSSLAHRNIIKTFDIIVEGSLHAVEMEYASRGNLRALLREGPIEVERALELLSQIASALSAIHGAGFLHRDLKPENILITADGHAKVTDFGTATPIGMPAVAAAGMLIGTPKYVAPEYVETGRGDERGDIYALGVIAFEMLAGFSPFRAKTVEALVVERLDAAEFGVKQLVPGCPDDLAALIERAMAPDPEERFQSADELRREIENLRTVRRARLDTVSGEAASNSLSLPAASVFLALFLIGQALSHLGSSAIASAPGYASVAHTGAAIIPDAVERVRAWDEFEPESGNSI